MAYVIITLKKGSDAKHMSRFEYQNEYNQKNYFKVALRIPKEKKEVLQELAKLEKVSVNKLIINAVEQFYNVDLSRKGDE